MIFDIENWLWKSVLGTFWRPLWTSVKVKSKNYFSFIDLLAKIKPLLTHVRKIPPLRSHYWKVTSDNKIMDIYLLSSGDFAREDTAEGVETSLVGSGYHLWDVHHEGSSGVAVGHSYASLKLWKQKWLNCVLGHIEKNQQFLKELQFSVEKGFLSKCVAFSVQDCDVLSEKKVLKLSNGRYVYILRKNDIQLTVSSAGPS